MSEHITDPRLIFALFREIAMNGTTVFCRAQGGESQPLLSELFLNAKADFKQTRIRLNAFQKVPIAGVDCDIMETGKRLHFSLKPDGAAANSWPLPENVEVNELRRDGRMQFDANAYTVQIGYAAGLCKGHAVDISSTHIAVDVQEAPANLAPEAICDMTVRHGSSTADLWSTQVVFVNTINGPNGIRMLFRFETQANRAGGPVPRPERVNTSPFIIEAQSAPGVEPVLQCAIQVDSVSLTGIAGEIIRDTPSPGIIPGLVLHCSMPDITFVVVRREPKRCAGKVLFTEGEKASRSWVDFVHKKSLPSVRSLISPTEITKLFEDKSGTRNKSTHALAKKSVKHLVQSDRNVDNRLGRRYVSSGDLGSGTLQVNLSRFSDHAWFMEPNSGGVVSAEDFDAFLMGAVAMIREESLFVSGAPRYLTTMYDPAAKRHSVFGADMTGDKGTMTYVCLPCPMALFQKDAASSAARITDIQLFDAEARMVMAPEFSSILLSAMDYWNPSRANAKLNDYLVALGPGREANLALAVDEAGAPLALVWRQLTPPPYDTRDLANAVFVSPAKSCTAERFQTLLHGLTMQGMARGTEDLVLLMPPSECDRLLPERPGKRELRWTIVDMREWKPAGGDC